MVLHGASHRRAGIRLPSGIHVQRRRRRELEDGRLPFRAEARPGMAGSRPEMAEQRGRALRRRASRRAAYDGVEDLARPFLRLLLLRRGRELDGRRGVGLLPHPHHAIPAAARRRPHPVLLEQLQAALREAARQGRPAAVRLGDIRKGRGRLHQPRRQPLRRNRERQGLDRRQGDVPERHKERRRLPREGRPPVVRGQERSSVPGDRAAVRQDPRRVRTAPDLEEDTHLRRRMAVREGEARGLRARTRAHLEPDVREKRLRQPYRKRTRPLRLEPGAGRAADAEPRPGLQRGPAHLPRPRRAAVLREAGSGMGVPGGEERPRHRPHDAAGQRPALLPLPGMAEPERGIRVGVLALPLRHRQQEHRQGRLDRYHRRV